MLLTTGQLRLHLIAAVPTLVLCIVCAGYYGYSASGSDDWPGGGSAAGLACGIAAGSIIAFEMLLWPRKLLRRFRLIPTKYWMSAHIWLGLASLPLAILHCGFHFGGWLPTIFMYVFAASILSGIYGLAVQNIVPRWMLRNLPAETIYGQIDFISQRAVEDARRMLLSACGPDPSRPITIETETSQLAERQPIVVGAVRNVGRSTGRVLRTRTVPDARQDASTLWEAMNDITPFLLEGASAESPVSRASYAGVWFDRLADACTSDCSEIIQNLRSQCDARRQFDSQKVVHRMLHAWLPLHIAVSIMATALLVVHIITALRYW